MESQWKHKIFTENEQEFEALAMEIFRFQYAKNPVYHEYINALPINVPAVKTIKQIPFLPIRFFKSHSVQTTTSASPVIFESSGTTGGANSRHFVKDIDLYKKSITSGFEFFYGPAKDWCIIGLLPSYVEKGNSSLVYMVNDLVQQTKHPRSGFYLHENDRLFATLTELERAKQKTILLGVTFALLDFAGDYSLPLEHTIIMETGGMKGRREDMIREEVHDILQHSFSLPAIHSEYGMTELLSQAYSKGNGVFNCPPWMKILIRDYEDPLDVQPGAGSQESGFGSQESGAGNQESGVGSREPGAEPKITNYRPLAHTGVINVIDLANIYSCSFIATEDAGKLYKDGSFEVLGRIDNSDLRGCSLLTI
jgi:hypothetical protein